MPSGTPWPLAIAAMRYSPNFVEEEFSEVRIQDAA
jgi:hypothetical protein